MTTEARIGILALLAACQPASMGQFGEEEEIRCEPTSRIPLLAEDTVEIGYADAPQSVSVGDMLEIAAGTFTETLVWSDASETAVTALLEHSGSPELVTWEHVGGAHETETVAGLCPTKLEFTVDVTLTTDDARLSDGFIGAAHTTGESVWVEHRITAPGGTIDVEALSEEGVDVEPDVIRVDMRVSQEGTSFSGSLLPQPIGGTDDDAQPLGTWPAGEVEE